MSADPNELDATAGLQHRYDVQKVNDPTGKHADCPYFVLDPTHDPIARVALQVYANVARSKGYVALADDLDNLVRGTGEDVAQEVRNAEARIRTMIREAEEAKPPRQVHRGDPLQSDWEDRDADEEARAVRDEVRTIRDIEAEAERIGEENPTLSPEECQRRARALVLGEE